MAGIVNWVGRQRRRAAVDTITIGSNTVGQTFIVTVGGVKTVTYTAVAGDTTTAILAASLLAALQPGVVGDPTFAEITFAAGATASTIKATGPASGKPFTLAVSGTGTISRAATTAATSPEDWLDPANFDTGVIPNTGDVAVIANTAVPVLWNLDGNAAVFTVRRESTHTGRVGLPSTSDGGYPEYRKTSLEVKGVTVVVELNPQDAAGSLRFKSTGAAATYTVIGTQAGVLDKEVVEIYGTAAASAVSCVNASVAIAPLDGQVATVATLSGEASAVRVGSGTTLGDVLVEACVWRIEANFTSLKQIGGGSGITGRTAACANAGLSIYTGSVSWRSTGATGTNPVIGSGAVLDFTQAPGPVTVGGVVQMGAGGSYLDPRSVTVPFSFVPVNCRLQDIGMAVGTNRVLAVT